jgi:hypothetical protein
MQRYRFIKDNPDLVFTFLRSSPPRSAVETERRFNGKAGMFRGNFDSGDLVEIKPALVRFAGPLARRRLDYRFRIVLFLPQHNVCRQACIASCDADFTVLFCPTSDRRSTRGRKEGAEVNFVLPPCLCQNRPFPLMLFERIASLGALRLKDWTRQC